MFLRSVLPASLLTLAFMVNAAGAAGPTTRSSKLESYGYLKYEVPAAWKRSRQGSGLIYDAPRAPGGERFCVFVRLPHDSTDTLKDYFEASFTDLVGPPGKPLRPVVRQLDNGGRRAYTATVVRRKGKPDMHAAFAVFDVDGVKQCVGVLTYDAELWRKNGTWVDEFFGHLEAEQDVKKWKSPLVNRRAPLITLLNMLRDTAHRWKLPQQPRHQATTQPTTQRVGGE